MVSDFYIPRQGKTMLDATHHLGKTLYNYVIIYSILE